MTELRISGPAERTGVPATTLRCWDVDTCRSVKQRLQPMVAARPAQAEKGWHTLLHTAEQPRPTARRVGQVSIQARPARSARIQAGLGSGDALREHLVSKS